MEETEKTRINYKPRSFRVSKDISDWFNSLRKGEESWNKVFKRLKESQDGKVRIEAKID